MLTRVRRRVLRAFCEVGAGTRRLGASQGPPSPATAPRLPTVPPAGRAAAAAAGRDFGKVSASGEPQPKQCLLCVFLRLLFASSALGVGHRAGRSPLHQPSSPTPGREDRAPGQPSQAAGEARSSGAACAARAGGRPGLRAAPRAHGAALGSPGLRRSVLEAPVGCAPSVAPLTGRRGQPLNPGFLGAVPPVVRAPGPGSRAAGRDPSAASAPRSLKCLVGEPEIELGLGGARRGPRWDASGGRGLQNLGSWRCLRREGWARAEETTILCSRRARNCQVWTAGGHPCEIHRAFNSTSSPGTAQPNGEGVFFKGTNKWKAVKTSVF